MIRLPITCARLEKGSERAQLSFSKWQLVIRTSSPWSAATPVHLRFSRRRLSRVTSFFRTIAISAVSGVPAPFSSPFCRAVK